MQRSLPAPAKAPTLGEAPNFAQAESWARDGVALDVLNAKLLYWPASRCAPSKGYGVQRVGSQQVAGVRFWAFDVGGGRCGEVKEAGSKCLHCDRPTFATLAVVGLKGRADLG